MKTKKARSPHRPFAVPDKVFRRLPDVNIESDIEGKSKKLVILDIDGTVKNRLLRKALPDTRKWISECRERGLYVCLISNDRRDRHLKFAEETGLPLIAAAKKPSPLFLLFVAEEFGVAPSSAVMIGNNPFTDVLAAHRAGMEAYLVRPIETTLENPFLVRKRLGQLTSSVKRRASRR